MRSFYVVFSLVMLCSLLNAQNLVPNANFKDHKICPSGAGEFNADNWLNPINPSFGSTPDYFHECSGTIAGVPTNFVGFQEAQSGGAYAGLATYEETLGFREYIQAKLNTPTITGACYRLTIVYCPSENAGFSDGLGMFLSEGSPASYTGQDAQMEKTIIQESMDEWHTLTMDYISPGGETHVTIGNFNGNGDTNHVPNGTQFPTFGYYYIDSVAVENISVYSEDVPIDIGADMEVCLDDFPITINSNLPDQENFWSTGETGSSIQVFEPGAYFVETYLPCEYGADTITISIIEEPSFSVDNLTLCSGDSVTVAVDGALGEYAWDDGSVGSEFELTESGSYGVTLTYDCGEVVEEFFVSEIYDIEIPLTQDLEFCETDLPQVVQFAAFNDGINQFLWQDGTEAPGYLITEPGEYGVLIYNQCFSDSVGFTVDVEMDFPTSVDFTDTIACLGEEKEINIDFENVVYEWQDGSTEGSYVASGPGLYSVTVSNICRIEVFEFEIHAAEETSLDLGSDISICPGDSVLISSPNGSMIEWSTGAFSESIWVSESGEIVGQIDGYCGMAMDTIMISLDGMAPEVSVPDSLLLCAGDTISIVAADQVSGVEFSWNTGSEDASIEVFEAGLYIVSGENNCGLVTDSVVVVLGEALAEPGLSDQYAICPGDSLSLSVLTNGAFVEWSTGLTDSSIVLYEADQYYVSLTNSCGSKVDSFELIYSPTLNAIDLGEDVGICANGSVELDESGIDGNYVWSTGSTETTIELNMPGTYWLDIEGTCNTVSDTIEILDLGDVPEIDLGSDVSFCEGDTVYVGVGSADVDEVLWNTSSTDLEIAIFSAGTYIVIGTNACGSDSDTIQAVINNEVPTIDLGADQIICPGDSVLLDVGSVAGDIAWNTGESTSSIYVSASGMYIATLSSSCGSSTDTFQLEVSEAAPSLDLGEDVELCAGEVLEFDIDAETGTTILWSDGGETGVNAFTETGTIWLELSNYCGMVRDSMELTIIPEIAPVQLPEDVTICDDASYVIESGIQGTEVDIEWSTNAVESMITVDASGWYWVTASNSCFEDRDSIRVDFFERAEPFDLGMDDTICSGESIILEAFQGDEFIYTWQDASNSSDYTITESGSYSLEVSNECGTETDEINVLVLTDEITDVPLEDRYVLCNDVPLSIDLTNVVIESVLWNDGSTALERVLTEPGTYIVELINTCSDSIFQFELEHENCLTELIYIPNTFSPNEDGVNDYFSIWISDNWLSPEIKVSMYNRWGEQVFYSEDPSFSWDGRFKGKLVNPGVYVYYFELEVEIDGERTLIRETGDVTVVK